MTVDTETSHIRATNIVDGVPIACNFPASDATWIKVRYGADILATLNTHYTVALAGDFENFTVTPLAGFAVLSDGVIDISREPPRVQDFSLLEREEIASSALTRALDYLTYLIQAVAAIHETALTFPTTDGVTNRSPLPTAADRAGKYLAFDPVTGVPLAVDVTSTGSLAASAFGTTWVALANAASALVVLGISTPSTIGNSILSAANEPAIRALLDYVARAGNNALTGDNTFAGTSAFAGAVTVPEPTVDADAATKKYVDDQLAALAPTSKQPTTQVLTAGTDAIYTTGVDANGNRAKYIQVRWVGGGGGGGTGSAGTAGGDTIFNGIVADGGGGGNAASKQAKGGTGGIGGTGSALRRNGEPGGSGVANGSDAANGGNGGSTYFGGGGRGADGNGGVATNGNAAQANTGAGGGGGVTASYAGGAGGGGGGEMCERQFNNPAATYTYTIGAGGGGGASGGSGVIEIREYYNY